MIILYKDHSIFKLVTVLDKYKISNRKENHLLMALNAQEALGH